MIYIYPRVVEFWHRLKQETKYPNTSYMLYPNTMSFDPYLFLPNSYNTLFKYKDK